LQAIGGFEMNGLIGNTDSAKFIFVAIEDESQLLVKG